MNKWKIEFKCFECGHVLTDRERSYSHCCCPFCGYKDPGSITFVKTTERAYRLERVKPYWKFWIPKRKIYRPL